MRGFTSFLKWRWIRALQVWNHTSVRAQGGILALIPIIAVLVSFMIAIYGNRTRAWIEYDIQRKFKMVRQYNDLMTLMVDAETGERGFLITKLPEYLEPYQRATEQIPPTIASLLETIALEPGENPRLARIAGMDKIQELIDKQLASLKESQQFTRNGKSDHELYAHLQNGKGLMDAIRTEIASMQNKEEELLADRIEQINWIRYRDYIFVFIALFVGLVMRLISFYLFDRGIVRRLNKLTAVLSDFNKTGRLTSLPPKKDDAIGLLEQEIVKMVEQKDVLDKSTG